MPRLNDEELGRLLRRLPRRGASPDFTSRVLQRLAGQGEASRRAGLRRLSAAACLIGATLGVIWSIGWLRDGAEESRARERLETLRGEYEQLREELSKLGALAEELEELEPVMQLGGTGDVDFVIDLSDVPNPEGSSRGELQPVSRPSPPRNDGG